MSRTKDRTYLRNRKKAFAESDICHLCGEWIDPDIPWPDPMSASADHDDPVSRGGANSGPLRAAHLHCNQSRGSKSIEQVMAERQPQHGRAW